MNILPSDLLLWPCSLTMYALQSLLCMTWCKFSRTSWACEASHMMNRFHYRLRSFYMQWIYVCRLQEAVFLFLVQKHWSLWYDAHVCTFTSCPDVIWRFQLVTQRLFTKKYVFFYVSVFSHLEVCCSCLKELLFWTVFGMFSYIWMHYSPSHSLSLSLSVQLSQSLQ